jgi:hypothetical protein
MNGASLSRDATAGDGRPDIEILLHFQLLERLAHYHAGRLTTEEFVKGAIIDHDIALAPGQKNTRRR